MRPAAAPVTTILEKVDSIEDDMKDLNVEIRELVEERVRLKRRISKLSSELRSIKQGDDGRKRGMRPLGISGRSHT